MLVDRETAYQLLLAGGAVVLFVLGAVVVSGRYGTNGDLSSTGGTALVATIGAFVLVMLLVGLWLERMEFPDEDE